jgi:hypothetical protein
MLIDWYSKLRVVFKQEKKKYILETPYRDEPIENASDTDQSAYEKQTYDFLDVSGLMLATMLFEHQSNMSM